MIKACHTDFHGECLKQTKKKEVIHKTKVISLRSVCHNCTIPGDLLGLVDYNVGKEANRGDCKEYKGVEWALCARLSIQDDEEVSILESLCTGKEGEELSEKSKQRTD